MSARYDFYVNEFNLYLKLDCSSFISNVREWLSYNDFQGKLPSLSFGNTYKLRYTQTGILLLFIYIVCNWYLTKVLWTQKINQ